MSRGLLGAVAGIKKAFSGLNATFSALFGTTMINQIGKVTTAFIGLNNVLLTFSDSSEEAGKQMDYIISESQRLGFNVTEVAEAYKKFYAAGRIAGFETEKLQEVFSSLSETAAVVGMDSLQLEGAMRALQQMMSKGKVQAEELRGQLGEHLPGAFEIAAQAMGVTTGELDKMLSMGQVTAKALFENFPQALRDNYGSQLTAALRTPQRELERLKTDINLMIHELGPGFEALGFSILSSFRSIFSGIDSKAFDSINEAMKDFADVIAALPNIISNSFDIVMAYLGPWADMIWEIISWPFIELGKLFPSSGDPEIMGFWEWLLDTVTNTMLKVGDSILNLPGRLKAIFNITVRELSGFIETSVTFYEKIVTEAGLVFEKVSLAVNIAVNGMKAFFAPAFNLIIDGLKTVNDAIAETFASAALAADFAGFEDSAKSLRGMASAAIKATDSLDKMKMNTGDISAETAKYESRLEGVNRELDDLDGKYDKIYQDISSATLDDTSKILNDLTKSEAERNALIKDRIASSKAEIQYQEQLRSMAEMDKELAANKERETKKAAKTAETMSEDFAKKLKDHGGKDSPLQKYYADAMDSTSALEKATVKAFGGMEDALVEFVTTGKLDFSSLVDSIIADITRIAIKGAITGPLSDAMFGSSSSGGSGALGGMFGSMLGGGIGTPDGVGPPAPSSGGGFLSGLGSIFSSFFADGAAFNKGFVTAFANGGVVNSPTVFPMANGAGLMGEAGPEAIMPLKRGPGGKLGVEGGGGGNTINITVNVTGTDGSSDAVRRSAGQVAQAAGNATSRAMRRNG